MELVVMEEVQTVARAVAGLEGTEEMAWGAMAGLGLEVAMEPLEMAAMVEAGKVVAGLAVVGLEAAGKASMGLVVVGLAAVEKKVVGFVAKEPVESAKEALKLAETVEAVKVAAGLAVAGLGVDMAAKGLVAKAVVGLMPEVEAAMVTVGAL
jgi:hypothetical protein